MCSSRALGSSRSQSSAVAGGSRRSWAPQRSRVGMLARCSQWGRRGAVQQWAPGEPGEGGAITKLTLDYIAAALEAGWVRQEARIGKGDLPKLVGCHREDIGDRLAR